LACSGQGLHRAHRLDGSAASPKFAFGYSEPVALKTKQTLQLGAVNKWSAGPDLENTN
jgi:hypothetical protein